MATGLVGHVVAMARNNIWANHRLLTACRPLTQAEFAMRSGLGLRFVRELEQGKQTVRMDKVNQALAMFGMKAVPGRREEG